MVADGSLLTQLARTPHLRAAVEHEVQPSQTSPVTVLGVDRDAALWQYGRDGEAHPDRDERLSRILDAGLLHIFRTRQGFLEAGPYFHYISPSGRHTSKFMRIGNLLLRGVETEFIALGLLRYVPLDTRHIYTDTATINPIAYALADLRRRMDTKSPPITIDSFSCWSPSETFAWADQTRSVSLISASTSGTLKNEVMRQTEVPEERIITIFYGGESKPTGPVLCDLPRTHGASDAEQPPDNYDSEAKCKFCREKIAAVQISGDQFLPARPVVNDVLIRARHAPDWFSSALPALVGKEIITCQRGDPDPKRGTHAIAFDLEPLLQDESQFRRRVDRVLQTLVPAGLGFIVHGEDESSTALARRIAVLYAEHVGAALPDTAVIPADALRDDGSSPIPHDCAKTVLIVAGSTVSGRYLLRISQSMRTVCPSAPLAYLAALSRLSDRQRWSQLRSNLAYGEFPDQHPVHAAYVIELPDQTDPPDSWPSEEVLLSELGERDDLPEDQLAAVRERLALLTSASAPEGRGLDGDAFLPSAVSGEPLRLSKGFAFFGRDEHALWKHASHADVYFTMTAVLHGLRLRSTDGDSLRQFEHSRRVIGPENFARFTDGVVQAALLRAAKRQEINYEADDRLSSQMTDILLYFARRPTAQESEGLPEFLLAVACGRMTLVDNDLRQLAKAIGDLQGLSPLVQALVTRIGELVKPQQVAVQSA
jgi:hypothetical protein